MKPWIHHCLSLHLNYIQSLNWYFLTCDETEWEYVQNSSHCSCCCCSDVTSHRNLHVKPTHCTFDSGSQKAVNHFFFHKITGCPLTSTPVCCLNSGCLIFFFYCEVVVGIHWPLKPTQVRFYFWINLSLLTKQRHTKARQRVMWAKLSDILLVNQTQAFQKTQEQNNLSILIMRDGVRWPDTLLTLRPKSFRLFFFFTEKHVNC